MLSHKQVNVVTGVHWRVEFMLNLLQSILGCLTKGPITERGSLYPRNTGDQWIPLTNTSDTEP